MKHLLILTISSVIIGLSVQSFTPPMFQALAVTTRPQNIAGESATLKPSTTMEEAIGKAKHWEIIMWIWQQESGMGTNKKPDALHLYCRTLGKTNELGYGGMQNKWCYNTFDDVVGVVDDWFTKNLAFYELPNALCLYGLGEPIDDCGYWRKYKLL